MMLWNLVEKVDAKKIELTSTWRVPEVRQTPDVQAFQAFLGPRPLWGIFSG